jgi:hypothetical protein
VNGGSGLSNTVTKKAARTSTKIAESPKSLGFLLHNIQILNGGILNIKNYYLIYLNARKKILKSHYGENEPKSCLLILIFAIKEPMLF